MKLYLDKLNYNLNPLSFPHLVENLEKLLIGIRKYTD